MQLRLYRCYTCVSGYMYNPKWAISKDGAFNKYRAYWINFNADEAIVRFKTCINFGAHLNNNVLKLISP